MDRIAFFKIGAREQFDAVAIKSDDTLYWITDTQELYHGNVKMGNVTVTAIAETKGDKGDTGKSAYETAVEYGFEGTEEEFGRRLAAFAADSVTSVEYTLTYDGNGLVLSGDDGSVQRLPLNVSATVGGRSKENLHNADLPKL